MLLWQHNHFVDCTWRCQPSPYDSKLWNAKQQTKVTHIRWERCYASLSVSQPAKRDERASTIVRAQKKVQLPIHITTITTILTLSQSKTMRNAHGMSRMNELHLCSHTISISMGQHHSFFSFALSSMYAQCSQIIWWFLASFFCGSTSFFSSVVFSTLLLLERMNQIKC